MTRHRSTQRNDGAISQDRFVWLPQPLLQISEAARNCQRQPSLPVSILSLVLPGSSRRHCSASRLCLAGICLCLSLVMQDRMCQQLNYKSTAGDNTAGASNFMISLLFMSTSAQLHMFSTSLLAWSNNVTWLCLHAQSIMRDHVSASYAPLHHPPSCSSIFLP